MFAFAVFAFVSCTSADGKLALELNKAVETKDYTSIEQGIGAFSDTPEGEAYRAAYYNFLAIHYQEIGDTEKFLEYGQAYVDNGEKALASDDKIASQILESSKIDKNAVSQFKSVIEQTKSQLSGQSEIE